LNAPLGMFAKAQVFPFPEEVEFCRLPLNLFKPALNALQPFGPVPLGIEPRRNLLGLPNGLENEGRGPARRNTSPALGPAPDAASKKVGAIFGRQAKSAEIFGL
jgi:hypothetical protein